VIGDSVNMAARLCAEAQRGEIVSDTATLERSGVADRFGLAEKIQVRGRERPIDIRRMASVSPGSQIPLSARNVRGVLPLHKPPTRPRLP
jgi:class 3 adenylate cyclase